MDSFIALLYEALSEPIGLIVATNEPEKLRMRLYKLRKDDIDLQALSFIISPTNPNGELWIIKKVPDEEDNESNTEPSIG